jgi:hypothetical protein
LKRTHRLIAVAAAILILGLTLVTTFALRERVDRHRVFRPAGGEEKPEPPRKGLPPVEQWSETFRTASASELVDLLEEAEEKHPELYRKWSLGYLHARALAEEDEADDAAAKLAPFLVKDHPFRSRALYHRASIAEGDEASRFRTELITAYPDSIHRDVAIDDELAYLSEAGDSGRLLEFAAKVAPSASTERRRDMNARAVELLVAEGNLDAAFERGLALLNGGTGDDASDRVARVLDRPEIVGRLTTGQLAMFGETLQHHRHYDRAVALLQKALTAPGLSAQRRDELEFALGRSYFGDEQFVQSQNVYSRGAESAASDEQKATFLWHAARSAQLRGEDAKGEQLMTAAIAVKGTHASTLAALTQRIRTRVKQKRLREAASDLALLRRVAGNKRSYLEGALAYAVGLLAAGNPTGAIAALDSVPRQLLDEYDQAEFAYWRARALEERDPAAAFRNYLEVLRSDAPTHFAYFARTRLDSPPMAPKLERELRLREQEAATLIAGKQWDLARRVQTDRVLLSSRDHAAQLEKLAAIYRELPDYRAVLELKPEPLPRFPAVDEKNPDELLIAMGLYDEAVPAIEKRFALRPERSGLSRAAALNTAGASRESIYAIEIVMKQIPSDYHPDLLPTVARRLLYPRYFYQYIESDAARYDADPLLLLSIMREESRFNPRAKSQAAARGLLQFIITTARDIGRDVGLVDVAPEDLYDPRLIIRLGAKYVSDLASEFGGNRYRVAGAYNAGPKQVALWSRMQPAEGNDYFLTAVNFDETKHYIRKVNNSYERYGEIYRNEGPKGGLRAEP